ncbi:MAG TPA: DUF5916 domain-containing protein [Bacteroidales bacterium]|nr:DUF5916 domain-containing protein [Bacteroidales bacterium]
MKRILLIATAVLLCAFVTAQAPGEKKSYKATYTDSAPVIDGSLEDAAWLAGEWGGNFVQFEPNNGADATQRTDFKVLFDDNYIYVAIKAYDTAPDSISRRISRRDNADGDLVGISFDSYHDQRTGFVFIVNAAGVKLDMIWASDGQIEDNTWDPVWFTKAEVYDWGWAAEMKIPLTQLRFRIADGGVWGLEVMRQTFRDQETTFWQHIDRNSSGLIHNFGEITGLEGIRPRKQADVTPFIVGSYERYQNEAGNPFVDGQDLKYNGGLDAKLGITNNMTLDLTVNPDFGQVEADPSEVNLTAYETFFQEKRPFFIEGNNITSFKVGIGDGDIGNDNLFYSRRIGRSPHISPDTEDDEFARSPRNTPIISAAKVTGKTPDGLSIGILEAVTARAKADIDSLGVRSQQTVEPLTSYFVSRVMKDFDEGKTIIGGSYTNTHRYLDGTGIEGLVKSANTAGLDFTRYFKDRSMVLTATAAFSNLNGSTSAIEDIQRSSVHFFQRPDADYIEVDPTRTSLNGHGGNVQFGKVSGHWNFMLFGLWKSPGFDLNDLGYLQSADALTAVAWSAYTIDKPFSIFRRIRFNTNEWNGWDYGGNFQNAGGNLSVYAQLKNLWSFNIGTNYNGKASSNTMLRGGPSMLMPDNVNYFVNVNSSSSKMITAELWGNMSKGGEESSKSYSAGMDLTAKPGQSLSVSLSPSISARTEQLQYLTNRSFEGQERYILGRIDQQIVNMSLRLNYNITPDLTIQYWGQPFLAAMDYSNFKVITDPKAANFTDRFHVFNNEEIRFDPSENKYYVDENRDGIDDYDFENPDGNIDAFLSNLVVRWEFRPGSTIFLVWSQTRDYSDQTGSFSLNHNMTNLFSTNKPYDIFLVKFTYRFGLR